MLKIDRSFVTNLHNNLESQQIYKTIIGLARGMGMSVVAEGVETRGQAIQLNLLACDFGQGYLYARPRPADDIVEQLRVGLSQSGARAQDRAIAS